MQIVFEKAMRYAVSEDYSAPLDLCQENRIYSGTPGDAIWQGVHFEDFYPAMHTWFGISVYPSENGIAVKSSFQ